MENVSAGPKEGRKEIPVLNRECSDTWKTCSPVTGDTHGGKKKKKHISWGRSTWEQGIHRGGYRLVQPRACYLHVSLLIQSGWLICRVHDMPFLTDPCGFLAKCLSPIKMRETSPITPPSGASCLWDFLSWITPSLFLSLQPLRYLNTFPISL